MKAILVIDVNDDIDFEKGAKKKWYANISLKPMPQKKNINIAEKKDNHYELFTKNYIQGWNDCIDEMSGDIE